MAQAPERLLIVAHQDEWLGIQVSLQGVAAPNWRTSGLLRIWITDNEGSMLDVFSNHPVTWNDIPNGLQTVATRMVPSFSKDKLSRDYGCSSQVVSASHYFKSNQKGLFDLLHHAGISWEAYANDVHAKYDHSSSFTVSDWLNQCKRIGAYDLGKMILHGTRVKLTRECVKQFHDKWNGEQLDSDALIGVLSRMGKSGAALSPGLEKSFQSKCSGIGECIELCAEQQTSRVIHIFEDGLWTGIELKKIIDSLRGVAQQNPKCTPLRNTDDLRKNEIIFHFSVMTDLGYLSALDMFKKEGLLNFKIDDAGTEWVNVLTEEGNKSFAEGIVGFNEVENLTLNPDWVQPHFLKITDDAWGLNNLKHAGDIVSRIGIDLWKQRNGKIIVDPNNCAYLGFGSNGIGSTLIFSHSVSQAVLPILWCNGYINWGNKRLEWRGLYPERPYLSDKS